MDTNTIRNKCLGSLVGGAIGDAFGYPVEFVYSFAEIKAKYGDAGITRYDKSYPWLDKSLRHDKALFSDDTQMTLYTAEGIIESAKTGKPLMPAICDAYIAWYGPQVGKKVRIGYDSRLAKIDELNQNRAPGNTCLTALNCICNGYDPQNVSKGCGGIMRIAPIAIYGVTHGWTLEQTGKTAGEAAELTHGHKASTFASAVQAMIIQSCILSAEPVTSDSFKTIVDTALNKLPSLYPGYDAMLEDFTRLINKAVQLEGSPLPDWQIIEGELGEGWVADETLTIAIFSVLRHIDDFKACMISAVNHGGDSDSTGAVAGNILGAIHGHATLPNDLLADLQLHPLLIHLTTTLTTTP